MRLRRTLFGTIIRWYTLCAVAVLIVYTAILYDEIERGRRVPFDVHLDGQSERIASLLYDDHGELDLTHLPVHDLSNNFFAVYTAAWQPLLVSLPWYGVRWSTNRLDHAEFAERIAAGKKYHGQFLNMFGQDVRVAALRTELAPLPRVLGGTPLTTAAARVYVVCADLYEPMDRYIWRQKYRTGIAVAVIIIAIVISGVILTRHGLKPIKRLTRTAGLITPEDSRTRLPVQELPDELRELAQCLNDAFDRLDTALMAERSFTSAAAHELRSPVASVAARLDGLLQRGDLPQDARDQLGAVRAEAARLARVSGQLLLLARLDRAAAGESFATAAVDLEELARDAADSLQPAAAAEQAAIAITADKDVNVRGHEEWLLRAVYNVLGNAIKFTAPHTRIEIHIAHTADRKRITLSVGDQGPGIPPAERRRVFERFYRGSGAQSAEGTGLGLAIVADIVRAHKGEVFVSAGPGGRGAVITLILPRA